MLLHACNSALSLSPTELDYLIVIRNGIWGRRTNEARGRGENRGSTGRNPPAGRAVWWRTCETELHNNISCRRIIREGSGLTKARTESHSRRGESHTCHRRLPSLVGGSSTSFVRVSLPPPPNTAADDTPIAALDRVVCHFHATCVH